MAEFRGSVTTIPTIHLNTYIANEQVTWTIQIHNGTRPVKNKLGAHMCIFQHGIWGSRLLRLEP